jgi:hypothetical protein
MYGPDEHLKSFQNYCSMLSKFWLLVKLSLKLGLSSGNCLINHVELMSQKLLMWKMERV